MTALHASPLAPDVLASIGNTPLLQLRSLASPDHARVVVKVEGAGRACSGGLQPRRVPPYEALS